MRTYKLLEQDAVLLSQPVLIEHFGRAGAQFLNQLHYWLQHSDNLGKIDQGIRWIYNTAQNWAAQLRIGPRQIQRITKKLEESGVLRVQKLSDNRYNRTNHYTIDYDRLKEHLGSNNVLQPAQNSIATFCRNGLRQDVVMYRQKLPNKDFNKSEANVPKGQGGEEENQVEQVHDLICEKELDRHAALAMTMGGIRKDDNCTAIARSPTFPVIAVNPTKPVIARSETTRQSSSVLSQPSPPKPTTTRDMLGIWNEVLGTKAQGTMSKELAPLLLSAFAKKFDKNLPTWRTYCEAIKSSPYLMGEPFQLSIFWGLKFATIDRVRAGELGVKKDYVSSQGQGALSAKLEDEAIKKMIEQLPESKLAKQTRIQIATTIGYSVYHSWFHQAKFLYCNGEIRLKAPNAFVESIWERDYPWVKKGE